MTGTLSTCRDYLELTKPRILLLVLVSGSPPLFMASGVEVSLALATAVLVGIAGAGAAANTLNCYVERERDALMARTRSRPLPAARLEPARALVFGLVLGALATALLGVAGGALAAGLGVASILFYVFVYTVWLKPRSAWNAVVGGAAGAAAPLIADAAVHGSVGPVGLLLFAIIFLWQPPHVWAIALYRKAEYEQAGIPMLPSVIGDEPTRWRMLGYALALVPVTLAPVPLGLLGLPYLAAALVLDAWFVWSVVGMVRARSVRAARRVFHGSLVYLFALFLAMLLDRTLL